MVKHEDERAFPVTMEDGAGSSMTNLGMSLRDYFAAKAQAGMLANYNVINTPEHVAQMAYAHADAMLAERAKP